jgi:hypothetical protein
MEKYCPYCTTELVDSADVPTCPRHAIGDCTYDGYQLQQDSQKNLNSVEENIGH